MVAGGIRAVRFGISLIARNKDFGPRAVASGHTKSLRYDWREIPPLG
jgi:hypothetical protein